MVTSLQSIMIKIYIKWKGERGRWVVKSSNPLVPFYNYCKGDFWNIEMCKMCLIVLLNPRWAELVWLKVVGFWLLTPSSALEPEVVPCVTAIHYRHHRGWLSWPVVGLSSVRVCLCPPYLAFVPPRWQPESQISRDRFAGRVSLSPSSNPGCFLLRSWSLLFFPFFRSLLSKTLRSPDHNHIYRRHIMHALNRTGTEHE